MKSVKLLHLKLFEERVLFERIFLDHFQRTFLIIGDTCGQDYLAEVALAQNLADFESICDVLNLF